MKRETEKYSFDELKFFFSLLDEAWRQAKSRNHPVSIHDMLEQLFLCAASGERTPESLMAAMLACDDAVVSTSLPVARAKPFLSLPVPDAYLIRMVGRPVMTPVVQAAPIEIPLAS